MPPSGGRRRRPIELAFVLWFNGNGIPEQYWIPRRDGADYEFTPCLRRWPPFASDIHVISGLDNPAARMPGPGNDHHRSMSGLVSGTSFTGRGAGGPSIDQVIAPADRRADSRFRSLQIGVCQESFGESIQRNMSWAGRDRPLPPEMIPHKLSIACSARASRAGWSARRACWTRCRTILRILKATLGKQDQMRLDEHLASVRDLERSIASLPPEYAQVVEHRRKAAI